MRKAIIQLIFKTLNIVLLAFFLSLVQFSLHANNLKQEIEVIEKLYKDGVLTKEEFEKTKKILIRNAEKKKKKETKLKVKKTDVKPSDIKVNITTKPIITGIAIMPNSHFCLFLIF